MTDPREQAPEEGPVIRDKRRLDPETGQLRESAVQAAAPAAAGAPEAPGAPGHEPGAGEGVRPEDGPPVDETAQ